ncbi:hypothetical protein SDC9_75794 [bioreactor metagenome]|uniref:Uncharacterized protein n=1 Tax=bioreactor metagenome TaxID=1076179 RepID=A0A644YT62_9ZZZZ
MDCFSVTNLELANLQRTQYLLCRYPEFLSQAPTRLDAQISKAVLDILSFSLCDREVFTQDDRDLMDHCGAFLAPALLRAAEEIKSFPIAVVSKVYPVLYHQYFAPEGTAIDLEQLSIRIEQEDCSLSAEEIQNHLTAGERMMSTLLFQNHFVTAMHACS